MPLIILHVEDDKVVADTVRDALQAEGLRVVTCADGAAALNKLAAGTHFDLLITDNDLLHADGLQIVRYARSLPHLRHTPIIMFTASECRAGARAAGVTAYLRKPEDINRLAETVAVLLDRGA